jgi:hypothetical protein
MTRVRFVMKGGVVHKHETGPTPSASSATAARR